MTILVGNEVLPRQLQLKYFCNMLSNCMMLKIPAITKICGCTELTDKLNTWRRTFIMTLTMLCNFEILPAVKDWCEAFQNISKHYVKFFAGLVRNLLSSIICSTNLGILLFKILIMSIMTFQNVLPSSPLLSFYGTITG